MRPKSASRCSANAISRDPAVGRLQARQVGFHAVKEPGHPGYRTLELAHPIRDAFEVSARTSTPLELVEELPVLAACLLVELDDSRWVA